MLKELANGKYFCYVLEDGGLGIVKADNPEEAENKVRESYKKHGGCSDSTEIKIYGIGQEPFDDTPDVIEIYEDVIE